MKPNNTANNTSLDFTEFASAVETTSTTSLKTGNNNFTLIDVIAPDSSREENSFDLIRDCFLFGDFAERNMAVDQDNNHALILAVKNNNLEELNQIVHCSLMYSDHLTDKSLLKNFISHVNDSENTAFHEAILGNNIEAFLVLMYLLLQKPDLQEDIIQQQNFMGEDLMALAAKNQNPQFLGTLLTIYKLSVEDLNHYTNYIPREFIKNITTIHQEVRNIKFINLVRSYERNSDEQYYLENMLKSEIVEVDINYVDYLGQTALLVAYQNNLLEVVRFLLEKDAKLVPLKNNPNIDENSISPEIRLLTDEYVTSLKSFLLEMIPSHNPEEKEQLSRLSELDLFNATRRDLHAFEYFLSSLASYDPDSFPSFAHLLFKKACEENDLFTLDFLLKKTPIADFSELYDQSYPVFNYASYQFIDILKGKVKDDFIEDLSVKAVSTPTLFTSKLLAKIYSHSTKKEFLEMVNEMQIPIKQQYEGIDDRLKDIERQSLIPITPTLEMQTGSLRFLSTELLVEERLLKRLEEKNNYTTNLFYLPAKRPTNTPNPVTQQTLITTANTIQSLPK